MISCYLRLLLAAVLLLLECHGFFRDYSSWMDSTRSQASRSFSLSIFRSRGTTKNIATEKSDSVRKRSVKKAFPSDLAEDHPADVASSEGNDRFTHIIEKMNSEEDPNKLTDILLKAMTAPKKAQKQSHSTNVQASNLKGEFKRVVNIEQIPRKRPILCKLLVKEHEKASVAKRFDVPQILYFAANITMTWRDAHSLSVSGSVEGQIGYGNNDILSPDTITTQFDTLLLNNVNTNKVLRFEDEKEYDDEIKADGNIDIAEIACQYFEMEI